MIRLSHSQLVAIIYSSDPIGLYEDTLESMRNQSALSANDNGVLKACIDQSLVDMFDADDDGFSDEFIEEDYRDPFFDDHNVQDFPL